jgi:hypothetical protein
MDGAPDETTLEHFRRRGWMRVPGAFSAEAAEAMREVVWRFLGRRGILKDRPDTWSEERPPYLQALKSDPVFEPIGSPRTLAAIDAALEGQPWAPLGHWGSAFLVFPADRPWAVPTGGWHCDGPYVGSLSPPFGVKVHAMFGDVEPRAGGMLVLGGSHLLLDRWFAALPPPAKARSADKRESLKGHPYIRDLHAPGDPQARLERFMGRAEEVDGIELQVAENTARAGDVILMHELLLHAAPTVNAGTQPRFLLNADILAEA